MTEVEKLKHEITRLRAIISISSSAQQLLSFSEKIRILEIKNMDLSIAMHKIANGCNPDKYQFTYPLESIKLMAEDALKNNSV